MTTMPRGGRPLNVADQRSSFIRAMMGVQEDRVEVTGRHVWQEHMDEYGPSGYITEMAGIMERLKAQLWPSIDRVDDLSHADQSSKGSWTCSLTWATTRALLTIG